MESEIIVVGSCNVDLTSYVNRMPVPGETISGSSFNVSFGGKGANQAVMAKLLGGKVTMVGKVGLDFFGGSYIEHFRTLGIETKFVERCESNVSTGTASIIVNDHGQNCIIVVPGANSEVTKDYVSQILPKILTNAKVLMVQMEIDREATLQALKMAKQAKVITIFNVAPAYTDLSKEFYENTDILCVNETELEILSGQKVNFEDSESLRSASQKLVSYGCTHIIVTLGELGAILYNKKYPNGLRIPLLEKVDHIVDTTGSGDAFVGTLSYYIAQKITKGNINAEYLTPEIIEKGVLVATSTIRFKGAQSSYSPAIESIHPSKLVLS